MEKKKFIDYYKILGVSFDASDEELKKVHKNLAKKYHPDIHPNLSDEEKSKLDDKLKEINSAYDILTNKEERASYDEAYRKHKERQAQRQYQQTQAKNSQTYQEQRHNSYTTNNTKSKSSTSNNTKENTRSHYETNNNRQRKSSHNTNNHYRNDRKVVDKKAPIKNIINDYKEIKEDEKKQPFMKRHRAFDQKFCHNFAPEDDTIMKNIIFQFGRGTVHVGAEFIHQILKLRYITEDSIPKFVLRNRVLVTGIIATIIASNVVGGQINNQPSSDDTIAPTSSAESLEDNKNIMAKVASNSYQNNNKSVSKMQTEPEEENLHVLNRIYTVESGDTLATLSASSNTTINCIEQANNIDNDNLFVGQELVIPYYVEDEEMSYYTSVKAYSSSMKLEDLAAANETDVATLIKLNEEAIVKVNNKYAVITDTIIVPTFITRDELETQKVTTKVENVPQKTY